MINFGWHCVPYRRPFLFRPLLFCCLNLGPDNDTGKAKLINMAIQDIGMGRYQWELYILCGRGWAADK